MNNVIEVQNLIKKYKNSDVNAVDDISFSIGEGELFAFLGPNGAGKTTTISILTTTLSKTSGKVTVNGFDLDTQASEVRRSIGVIFQKPSLDLNLTAEENVRFHVVLYGLYSFKPTFSMMPKDYRDRVMELADILDIKNDIFKPIKTFSGGMKRKLEIIRSIMHHPKLLFLDEPTEGLDPLSKRNLWEYLKEVRKKEKTTIFLTTHYLEEAEDSDNVCIINHGKIVVLGTPEKIKEDLMESYIEIDSEKRSDLITELKKLKLDFDEDRRVKVDVENKNIQQIIQSIKTPLNVLKIHNPSLEEAYLEIVDEKKHASN